MRHRLPLILLLAGIILLAAGRAPAEAIQPDALTFARVVWRDAADLEALDAVDAQVYERLGGHTLLVGIPTGVIDTLAAGGYRGRTARPHHPWGALHSGLPGRRPQDRVERFRPRAAQ